MVFYRKYRPQTISQLDLTNVREKLSAVLSSPSIPHALLFTGPKGLGKTSSARIFAKALNCENIGASSNSHLASGKTKQKQVVSNQEPGSTIEPCNNCSTCISITNGSNIDVIEIDAASNRGVDEIRDLRERVKFSPASVRKKVYIIDEVHMLTAEAFNALLKTLEEPPEHTVFILATTEKEKLPPTITSRTFTVQFEKPTFEEYSRSIQRILDGETIEIESDAARKLYNLADGSFRDAAKILEELAIASQKKSISLDTIENTFKSQTIDNDSEKLLEALKNKDTTDALAIVQNLADKGVNFKQVIEVSMERLRLQLISASKSNGSKEINKTLDLIQLFQKAYEQFRYTPIPQLPIELAIVEYCVLGQVKNQEVINKKNDQDDTKRVSQEFNTSNKPSKTSESKKEIVHSNSASSSETRFKLIDAVKKENQTIAGILRSCQLDMRNEIDYAIVAPYKFHADKLNEPKNMLLLGEKLSEIVGKKVVLHVTIKT